MGWPPLNRDFGQSKFSYETNSWSYEKFVGLGSYIAARREGCQEFCCEDSDAGIACYYGVSQPYRALKAIYVDTCYDNFQTHPITFNSNRDHISSVHHSMHANKA